MSQVLSFGNGRSVVLDPWCLMGILNATPDSFSDGGEHLDPVRAVTAGYAMVAAGATILDVGGESTRPGSQRVTAEEQLRRVLPVIEGLRRKGSTAISIDTTSSEVARAAIDTGADMVNDVSAGTEDPRILDLVSQRGCPIVLMHRLRQPEDDSFSDQYESPPEYDDVVVSVGEFLGARAMEAQARGIAAEKIVLDPGLGFGKTVEQNLALVARIDEIVALGYPVLLGASRKSFLGAIGGGENPVDRGIASIVMAIKAWEGGASILRVHEPGPHLEALKAARSIMSHEGDRPATIPSP